MGTLRAQFGYRDADSTETINYPNRIQTRGVLIIAGTGTVSNVPGELKVSVAPFQAVSGDGMIVFHETSATSVTVIDLGATPQYIMLKAVYNASSDPDLAFETMTVAAYDALSDEEKEKRIRLATFIVVGGEVPDVSISFTCSDRIDTGGRSPFRGLVANIGTLPADARWNRVGDFYLVESDHQHHMWDGSVWVVTSDAALLEVFGSHRNNGGVAKALTDPIDDEHHMTEEEHDGVIGAVGGALTVANPVVSSDLDRVNPSRQELIGLVGVTGFNLPDIAPEYYIGTGVVGTANLYFRLMEAGTNLPLKGTDGGPITISGIYVAGGPPGAELVPAVDGPYYDVPWVELDFSGTGDATFTGNLSVRCGTDSSIGALDVAAFLLNTDLAVIDIEAQIIWQYSCLKNGINLTSYPRLFRVRPTGSSVPIRGYPQWSSTLYVGSNVFRIDTDGLRVYVGWAGGSAEADHIRAYDPEDCSLLWTWDDPDVDDVEAFCTDGLWVYCAKGIIGGTRLYTIVPSTGVLIAIAPGYIDAGDSTAGINDMAANGSFCVTVDTTGDVKFFSGCEDGVPAYDGFVSHGSELYAVAVDWRRAYVGGVQSAGVDLRAYTLSTRAQAWGVALPTTGAAVINDIATDGERVYVAVNYDIRTDIAVPVNVFCYSVISGVLLWGAATSTENGTNVSCDDNYVYLGTTSDASHILDKVTGEVFFDHAGSVSHCNDGLSFFAASGAVLERLWTGYGTRIFMRVDGEDPERRPFHHLAIPGTA